MASVSEVVKPLPYGESSGLDGICEARQGSFGSSRLLIGCPPVSFFGKLRGDGLGSLGLLSHGLLNREVAGCRSVVTKALPCGKRLTDAVRSSPCLSLVQWSWLAESTGLLADGRPTISRHVWVLHSFCVHLCDVVTAESSLDAMIAVAGISRCRLVLSRFSFFLSGE